MGGSQIPWQKQPGKICKIRFGEMDDQWSNLWLWHLGLDKPPIWTADEIIWPRLQLGPFLVGIIIMKNLSTRVEMENYVL